MFHYLDYKRSLLSLHRAGLSHAEINRLIKFRRNYTQAEADKAQPNHRHLEFVRWLVLTGKLTEQVP